MAQAAAGPSGPADPMEVALIDGIIDERVAVASANARFEAAIAWSDVLLDDERRGRLGEAALARARTLTWDAAATGILGALHAQVMRRSAR